MAAVQAGTGALQLAPGLPQTVGPQGPAPPFSQPAVVKPRMAALSSLYLGWEYSGRVRTSVPLLPLL